MTNKEQAKMLRSAASALEHGRYATAQRKVAAVYNALLAPNVVLEIGDPEDPENCTCAKRSWYGPEHDSVCPVDGLR